MRSLLLILIVFLCFHTNSQVPVFQWAGALSGNSFSGGQSITVDEFGNAYTVGTFSATVDFDPGPGVYNLSSVGTNDVYISKLDASGNFVWAKSFAVNCYYHKLGIALDTIGNLFVSGQFFGTVDFDPGIMTNTITAGGYDVYISKFNQNGNYIWTKTLGGLLQEDFGAMRLDMTGNIYTTGLSTGSGDFDPGPGTFTISSGIFVSKLDPNGNFIWAKAIASSGDRSYSIEIDKKGNVYTTGNFYGIDDFDPSLSSYTLNTTSGSDMFISKLDINGDFVWAKQIGGAGLTEVYGHSIRVDSLGNVFTAGRFEDGIVDFDPGIGTYTLTAYTGGNLFVSKLDSTGSFVWAKCAEDYSGSGLGTSVANALTIDKSSNVYLTGNFQGHVDFDPGPGTYTYNAVNPDIFVLKLDSSGNYKWSIDIGDNFSCGGTSITLDNFTNIYSTGWFYGAGDFDPGTGVSNLNFSGPDDDAFILKIGQSGVGIQENNMSIGTIRVYPNPNNGSFKLKISQEIKNGELILINSLGQKVHEQKISEGENNIITQQLSKGLYNFVLLQDKQQITNGKIIIE